MRVDSWGLYDAAGARHQACLPPWPKADGAKPTALLQRAQPVRGQQLIASLSMASRASALGFKADHSRPVEADRHTLTFDA